uniref:Glycosyltransferase n=1 Tax=Thermodesulfobium narugense TaxID=184064 RepID=A0A7C5KGI6_9BACT
MKRKEFLISIFLPSLGGGGAEKVALKLAEGFVNRGFNVDLVLLKAEGPYLNLIPKKCTLYVLNSRRALFSLFKLVKYLKSRKPSVFISNLTHLNIVSLLTKLLFTNKIKFVIVEHLNFTKSFKYKRGMKKYFLYFMMKSFYPYADKIIAVSQGVAMDFESLLPGVKQKIKVIYNPIPVDEIIEKSKEPLNHPWFKDSQIPVILSAGRLSSQKDFGTLMKAFSLIRKELKSRLVILGEGEERKNLENLAKSLGIYEDILMPGFVDNPYKFMSKASVFVLSSIYEGFANVIVEAMACGLSVVSTDCESGPREILEDGKYGKLVPVGDPEALAKATMETIKNPYDKEFLILRARDFSVEAAVSKYLEIIE